MSFKQATAEAPASAAFIGFKQSKDSFVIIYRRSDGILDVCANTSGVGYEVFIAGVAARKLSFWDADAGHFVCGSLDQLINESKEA